MNTNTKYRCKTYEIDAFQIMTPQGLFSTEVWPGWLLMARNTGTLFMNGPVGSSCSSCSGGSGKYIYILRSGKRLQIVNEGDWITRGENGSLAVVPDEEFRTTHEPIPAPELNPNHDRHSFMKFLRSEGIEDLSLDDRIETFLNILPNGRVITKDLLDKLLEDYNRPFLVVTDLEDEEDTFAKEMADLTRNPFWRPLGTPPTQESRGAREFREFFVDNPFVDNPMGTPPAPPSEDDPGYQEFLEFVDNLMGTLGKPRKDRKS